MGTFLLTILLLSLMEISLSFDNAAMNATILRKMSVRWQHIFLSWGILISVFLVRLILPAIIVAISADIPIYMVVSTAMYQPEIYGKHVLQSHSIISSFGGSFLLMVYLSFLLDSEKETHWIGWLERIACDFSPRGIFEKSVMLGSITISMVAIIKAPFIPALVGVITFFILEMLKNNIGKEVVANGLSMFLYLEVLDASFSLDGVVAAFSMSSDIIAIMIGLGIGSLAIRNLTVYMVRKRTLEAFIYLEHGAHYSIGALGFLMLMSTFIDVPQIFIGLIGILFIGMSIISSEIENRRDRCSR